MFPQWASRVKQKPRDGREREHGLRASANRRVTSLPAVVGVNSEKNDFVATSSGTRMESYEPLPTAGLTGTRVAQRSTSVRGRIGGGRTEERPDWKALPAPHPGLDTLHTELDDPDEDFAPAFALHFTPFQIFKSLCVISSTVSISTEAVY